MSSRMNLKILSFEALDWLKDHAYLPQGSQLLKAYTGSVNREKGNCGAGATVAPYREIQTLTDIEQSIEELGLPCCIKNNTWWL